MEDIDTIKVSLFGLIDNIMKTILELEESNIFNDKKSGISR